MTSDAIVSATAAAATWAAVIVAIWGDRLRSWINRPRLELDLLSVAGEPVRVDYRNIESGQLKSRSVSARYYHLRVKNFRRFATASDVQILVTKVEVPGPDRTPQVTWTGEIPFRWRHQEIYPLLRKVGRATDADLLYVTDEPLLRFTPVLVPNNFPAEYRGAARIWLTAVAQSSEAASNILRIELAWDGCWEPGEAEMQRHLTIRCGPGG